MADYGEGYKYQRSVTAYLASLLSKDRAVKDYQIFYEVQEFHPFDDIVLAVNYHDSDACNLYFIQVKSGKIKLEINKYMKGYDDITKKKNWDCLRNVGKINRDNIQFWYFACQKTSSQTTFFQKGIAKYELHIKEHASTNKSIIYNKIHKLSSLDADVATEYKQFFNDFYIFLGQPNAHIIVNKLKDIWKSNDAAQIIEFLDKYFTSNKTGSLNKVDIEHELLRIYLSDSIMTPTKTVPFKKESALAWNELTLSHNVTIVNETAIETCLFGCILQNITPEIDIDRWNRFVDDNGRLSKEYKEQLITNSIKPETLKNLLIHLWKRRKIPLILKPNNALQLLKDFSHLDQHYIIIDSDPSRRYDEMTSYGLSAIKNLGNKTDKLLQSISVSMQGREPASLYTVINGDRRLVQAISCSDVLKLTEPRIFYLSKDCLEGDNYMLFIIEAVDSESMNNKSYTPNGCNISIYCHFANSEKIYDEVKADPKFEYYKMYRLRFEDDKLMFASKCSKSLLELNNFLVDQYGHRVYSTGEENAIPIIGTVTERTCLKYLERHLCKDSTGKRRRLSKTERTDSTITSSEAVFPENNFFKKINERICVVVGEAGIGKTTFLQTLLQMCDSQYYVLFSNLARYQQDMRRNTQKLFEDPINFLWNKQECLTYKRFLNTFVNCRKRLILILDSFDEVAPTCEKQVMKLISKLEEETCLERIVIGSRSLTVKLLSNQFTHIDIVTLLPFNTESNGSSKYLENWGFHENDLQQIPSEFVANPLYLGMLKTISRNITTDFRSFSRWVLYKHIVRLEITRYCERTGYVLDAEEKTSFLKFYWELAVKLIFGSNSVTEKFAVNRQVKVCNYARLGFVKYINENEEPAFVHYTFAEFFAASWLLKSADRESVQNIYLKILINKNLDVLHIHSEQFPLHKIVYNNTEIATDKICTQIKNLCRENEEVLVQTDGLGRTALHLAAIRYRRDKAASLETIIQCMLENRYDLYSRDALLSWTWVDLCETNVYFNITNFLPPLLATQEAYWNYHASHALKNTRSKAYVRSNINFFEMYKTILRYPSFFNIIKNVLCVRYCDNKEFIRFHNLCLNTEETDVKLLKYFKLDELHLTPLHMAVIFCDINAITACLQRGDKINARDVFGCTPLYYSIGKDESEIVNLLLKKGANVNLHPNLQWGFNSFQLNLHRGNKAITQMLIEKVDIKKFGSNWLCDGIKFGTLEVTEMLLKAKADPNKKVRMDSNTHFETEIIKRDVREVLTQFNADNNDLTDITIDELLQIDEPLTKMAHYMYSYKKNIYFTRPIHEAIHTKRKDIIELLLKNNADVNLEVRCHTNDLQPYTMKYWDRTPLYCAIKWRTMDTIQLLLEHGANVNYINEESLTPLVAAANYSTINVSNRSIYFELASTLRDIAEIEDLYFQPTEMIKSLYFIHDRDWSLITSAQQQRSLQLVEILLKKGANVNVKDEHQLTLLDNALEKQNWSMMELLLENEVNAHLSKQIVFTELLDVVPGEHIKIIELLLKKGVDPNFKMSCDVTPLYVAARKRNPDMVRLLLENGAAPNIVTCTDTLVDKAKEREEFNVVVWLWNLDDTCSLNPTYYSTHPAQVLNLIRTVENQTSINLVKEIDIARNATEKKLKLVERALEYGANLRNPHSIKYLNAVHELKNKDVDQILIRHFMRLHAEEIAGYTECGYAATQRSQTMIEILSRNGKGVNDTNDTGSTPLVAVIKKKVDQFVFELLLANGADINLADSHGNTPLIVGIDIHNNHITKTLIENNVIVDYVGKCGRTPLIAAVMTNNSVITATLLSEGADVNFASESGLTPLYVAILQQYATITKMLLRYGATSNIETCRNKLVFHAIISNHEELIKFLFRRRYLLKDFKIPGHNNLVEEIYHNQANVNAVNEFGSTPLHLAAQAEHVTVIYTLLDLNADPNHVDRHGRTALHYATIMNRKDIVEALLERKADATIKDNYGLKPLDYVINSEYHSIIDMLRRKSRKIPSFVKFPNWLRRSNSTT